MSNLWVIECKVNSDDTYSPIGLENSPVTNFFKTRKRARNAKAIFDKYHRQYKYRVVKYVRAK